MDRRRFAALSTAALASASLRGLPLLGQAEKPIGFAAIGLGSISGQFAKSIARSQQCRLTAVVTGHPDTKGQDYTGRYKLPARSVYTYENFDQIRDNKDVDAVYIGLPNSMHREFTLRAAAAGKHVLCEKPMAISSAECREMIDACKRAGVKLMIAYRCPQEPLHQQVRQLLRSGEIGQLQAFEGAFGFDAPPREQFWRLTKKLGGGGSLLDVGIYPLNAIRYMAREEPESYTAVASTTDHSSGRFAEVEQTIAWTMRFRNGVTASCQSSYGASIPGMLRVHGSKGTLALDNAFSYAGIRLQGMGSSKVQVQGSQDDTDQFRAEAEDLVHAIRTGGETKTPGEEGLRDLEAMEAIYKAAGRPIA